MRAAVSATARVGSLGVGSGPFPAEVSTRPKCRTRNLPTRRCPFPAAAQGTGSPRIAAYGEGGFAPRFPACDASEPHFADHPRNRPGCISGLEFIARTTKAGCCLACGHRRKPTNTVECAASACAGDTGVIPDAPSVVPATAASRARFATPRPPNQSPRSPAPWQHTPRGS